MKLSELTDEKLTEASQPKITTKKIGGGKYIVTDGMYQVELHKVFGWKLTALKNDANPNWHLTQPRHTETELKTDAIAAAKKMIMSAY